MKTYNNHPQWYNQPLRLTKEQNEDPLPVLVDFFECYHLNDTREILWEWLTDVISSPRGISIESHDRSNHLYFYEKIETLIEAAFVLIKSIGPEKDQELKMSENLKPDKFEHAVDLQENEEVFNKPKQLIEYINEDPLYVISEIFKSDRLVSFCDELRVWFDVALSAEASVYDEAEQRRQVLLFRDHLLILIEALYIIRTQKATKTDIKEIINEADKPKLLSRHQIANPLQIITAFYEKFPMVYITRELDDCLTAGICFSGPWPDNMCEVNVLDVYRNVLCLIKSAERLLVR